MNGELWAVILPVCSSNRAQLLAKFQPTTPRIARDMVLPSLTSRNVENSPQKAKILKNGEKWPKPPKKSQKIGKKVKKFWLHSMKLTKISRKNAKKRSFLWPGRAEKGAKKGQKRPFWALFCRENGIPCYKMGPERVQKVTFVTPKWYQYLGITWRLW